MLCDAKRSGAPAAALCGAGQASGTGSRWPRRFLRTWTPHGGFLGTCIAFPVVKHISQQAFRKVLLCVIAVAGLVCLVRALT